MTVNQNQHFLGNRTSLSLGFFNFLGFLTLTFLMLGNLGTAALIYGENQGGSQTLENRVLLLVFTSESCPACQKLEPLIAGFEKKNYPIRRLSPQNPSDRPLYDQYQIETIPSFVFLTDGRETDRLITQGEKPNEVKTRILQMFADGKKSLENSSPSFSNGDAVKTNASQRSIPDSDDSRSLTSLHQAVKNGDTSSLPAPQTVSPSAPNQTAPLAVSAADRSELLAASVRIRIPGANQSVEGGTGTLIHVSDSGKTREGLILTCGHLFRETRGKESVSVDIFDSANGQMTTVQGECVYYDDDLDIGFVGIPLPFPMKPASIVPPGYLTRSGDQLVSVGCSAGENPTLWNHGVLSVDKKFYQPKEENSENRPFYFIEVSNAPQAGRSGGGLFERAENGEYRLVGVCNAGDPKTDAGYFLPASVVYDQLYANKNLTFVYDDILRMQGGTKDNSQSSAINPAYAAMENQKSGSAGIRPVNFEAPADKSFSSSEQGPNSLLMTRDEGIMSQNKSSAAVSKLNADDSGMFNAGLEELKRCHEQGAEIICIINWPGQGDPSAPKESDVIRLNRSECP